LSHVNDRVALAVHAQPDRSGVIVAVTGDLDLAGCQPLKRQLDALWDTGWTSVVVDLRGVSFIDSTGLSLLLTVDRDAREHGREFAIVDGAPAVSRLLELVGLSGHFQRAEVG